MFETYRAWLDSELRLLGNASHHAYSIGQANMAKRALERFDEALREGTDDGTSPVVLALDAGEARRALDALDAGVPSDDASALAVLRSRLAEALGRLERGRRPPPTGAFVRPLDPEAVAPPE